MCMNYKRLFCLLLCCCAVFAACGAEPDGKIRGSEVWTEGLPLTWGQLEGEKLTVLPWDSGRCEATAKYHMAETRDGFYVAGDCRLLYADKVDLTHWVPVCGKPTCKHQSMYSWSVGDIMCDAEIGNRTFYIKNDRIWTDLYVDDRYGIAHEGRNALVSMSPTCTDRRLEVSDGEILEDMVTANHSTGFLMPWIWLYSLEDVKQDGSVVCYCFRYTDAGWEEYCQKPNDTGASGIGTFSPRYLCGDFAVDNDTVSTADGDFIRFLEEGYEILSIPSNSGYLSGDIFRYYKPGDGYYDFNVKTREEVKLADARMENGHAQLMLPNCIVESTLLSAASFNTRIPDAEHTMEIFDGQQWHQVTLPQELLVNSNRQLSVLSVTSDSILFVSRQQYPSFGPDAITDVYCIDLTRDTWELEFFAQIRDDII